MKNLHESVQNYYGKELSKSEDLKTNACCTVKNYPSYIKTAMGKIHDEVMSKYYGCGLTIPTAMDAMKVLDLGSGSGRDCYLAAQLVGENGEVVGVDMTDEQLEVSNRHIDYHTEKFGYKSSNTSFLKGYLEELDDLGLKDDYFDIIISNCVINLVKDKQKVLNSTFNKLKNGGEMYFSDVYVNKRIPKELVDDPVLYGECLSGSLYINDFLSMAKKAGFQDPRVVETAPITISNKSIQDKLEGYEFLSITYRLFKIEELEDNCEDFGQAVMYKGGIEGMEKSFILDDHHIFEEGKVEAVCGNTYRMLNDTRLLEYFNFYGDWSKHYGVFEGCGNNIFSSESKSKVSTDEGCC
ncbi:MAG: methyltransferase type 11 [Bacteriovorax sp. MedPE-SWde]|nr:MAG: methyltransferase type 11 [Bacteriovorax sp. MedPE-SWde]